MSMMYQDRVTVRRHTDIMSALSPASTSMAMTRTPSEPFYTKVAVSAGTTNAGEILISGTDSGGATATERLVWDGSLGIQVSRTRWGSITGVTSDGLVSDGASIEFRSVGQDGSPLPVDYRFVSDWPVHIDHGPADWGATRMGSAETEKTWMAVEYNTRWEPREGDHIVDQYGNRYRVQGASPQFRWAGGGESHWECDIIRHEIP